MVAYNQSIVVGSESLAVDTSALTPLNVKNAPVPALLEHYPEYRPIIDSLLCMVAQRRNMAVSVHHADLSEKNRTCMDTGFHLDGKMNPDDIDEYALVCFGPEGTRTLFHNLPIEAKRVEQQPTSVAGRHALFNSLLGHDLDDESYGKEVPDGVPVRYTTLDFHKGREAAAGKRIFIRLLSSNIIRPRMPRSFRRKRMQS